MASCLAHFGHHLVDATRGQADRVDLCACVNTMTRRHGCCRRQDTGNGGRAGRRETDNWRAGAADSGPLSQVGGEGGSRQRATMSTGTPPAQTSPAPPCHVLHTLTCILPLCTRTRTKETDRARTPHARARLSPHTLSLPAPDHPRTQWPYREHPCCPRLHPMLAATGARQSRLEVDMMVMMRFITLRDMPFFQKCGAVTSCYHSDCIHVWSSCRAGRTSPRQPSHCMESSSSSTASLTIGLRGTVNLSHARSVIRQ